ncbi:NHL domain-containing protein [Actinidia rufa]|uniref:NHL domain-containing protein n=1 Tax=Actinidia rufa TaxID=165716 RepID=A0A7J0EL30_9ERIC|nr:NHL domain-containing protein [Actinidia rufa]
MGRNWTMLLLIFVVLFSVVSSASATPPAKIVSGVVSNVVSALIKWLWSLKTVPKTEISSRSMMKFEGGYTVETVFDGSKLGIDPYSVEVSPFGGSWFWILKTVTFTRFQLHCLDPAQADCWITRGILSGHVDGKPREARMNHPKGITLDDRGNIYVADTLNMAIRKISDAGVVTIAGGKWSRGGGHVDGPSEDAKFSDDFDLVYIGSSCSLLVIDRGNQAIREIQLNEDDCNCQYDGNLHLGIAVLVAAGFFGYMLALLQRRVGAMISSCRDPETSMRKGIPPPPYQLPPKSVRPPLIPTEDEYEKPEEGLFGSMGRLFLNTGSSVVDLFTGLFSGRKKPLHNHIQQQYYQQLNKHSSPWPVQESFVIPDEDEPLSIETRTPAPRRTYPFATKDLEKNHHHHHQQQQQQPHQHQHWQYHHHQHYSSGPQTYYEQSCETNEIVFGEVQEQEGRRGAVVIKAVDYGDPMYNNHNIRSRYNYMGYSYGY